ncbi:MAG: hypothetical protein ACLFWL_16215 [Candidatus Brocadiia bacterium]
MRWILIVVSLLSVLFSAGCTSVSGPYITEITPDGRGNLIVEREKVFYGPFSGGAPVPGLTRQVLEPIRIPLEPARKGSSGKKAWAPPGQYIGKWLQVEKGDMREPSGYYQLRVQMQFFPTLRVFVKKHGWPDYVNFVDVTEFHFVYVQQDKFYVWRTGRENGLPKCNLHKKMVLSRRPRRTLPVPLVKRWEAQERKEEARRAAEKRRRERELRKKELEERREREKKRREEAQKRAEEKREEAKGKKEGRPGDKSKGEKDEGKSDRGRGPDKDRGKKEEEKPGRGKAKGGKEKTLEQEKENEEEKGKGKNRGKGRVEEEE